MSAERLITEHLDLWTSAVTYNRDKPELIGIDKLRELILELAVRGKLVPQDPEDEPASELLERIEEEKARLCKEGKIKKPKKPLEIEKEEKPFSLPDGWVWQRLTNIYYTLSTSGKSLKTSEIQEDGNYPVIDQGKAFVAGYTNDQDKLIYLPKPVVIFGDHTTARKYIDFNFVPGADGTKVLCPIGIVPKYFYTFLLSCQLENRGYSRHFKVLNSYLISIPPLEQQHRIVEKVDELMALCDRLEKQTSDQISAHGTLVDTVLETLTRSQDAAELTENWARLADHFDTLFTTEHSIDRLEQTILQLAVMGRLVPQDLDDEPAANLLERIGVEKRRFIQEGTYRAPRDRNREAAEGGLFPLPYQWSWAEIGELGFTSTGKTPSTKEAAFYGGGIPFIGPGQITSEGDVAKAEKYLTNKGAEETETTQSGDLVMVGIGGSIGKSALCYEEFGFNQQVHKITPIIINERYLYFATLTDFFQEKVWEKATGSATPIISRSKWDSIRVPVPPLAEQERIVEKVDQLMELLRRLKAQLVEASKTKRNFADSIVSGVVG